MTTARLIVCEKSGEWAVALRRALCADLGCVYETRSLQECWDELADSPASFLAIELRPENVEGVLVLLVRVARRYPQARAVVLARSGECDQDYEWLVKEAGVLHVVHAPRYVESAVEMALRHFAQLPQEELSLRESVWTRLPWGA